MSDRRLASIERRGDRVAVRVYEQDGEWVTLIAAEAGEAADALALLRLTGPPHPVLRADVAD